MKPIVIYHANCADGFGAAFAAWLKFQDGATYLPMQYGDVKTVADLNSVLSTAGIPFGEGEVYILDFSLPKDLMEWLFREVERVVWLDHHKTAFEMWQPEVPDGISEALGREPRQPVKADFIKGDRFEEHESNRVIILDPNKSGAMLAWEYFFPGQPTPMFIKHIDDYDRWQFRIEGTKEFNKALRSRTGSFEDWKQRFIDSEGEGGYCNYEVYYAEGYAILRAHDQNVESVVKNSARQCQIVDMNTVEGWESGHCGDIPHYASWPGLSANCPPHLTSDVGHELATQSGTFGLCWTLSQEGLIAKCSLRSNGDYDVSVIAKAFGGGGHKNAAGFEVPVDTLLDWLK